MTVIKIDNVSVKYKLTHDNIKSIKEYLINLFKGNLKYEEFWALKDVSFSIERGDVVGIVGRNGAGKSTLLKIVAEILKPTSGKVTHIGNIVPMLELGAGFDIDLSGKENIYLNGAILGYNKKYLDIKYDEIVEFSGLQRFIDTPIRNYSSGMLARLAFSIAAIVEPEILIVDEVLSVGDAEFQKKSYDKMQQLMSGGTTVLFVSHSIDQIRQMCNKVIWLENGMIKEYDITSKTCDAYIKSMNL